MSFLPSFNAVMSARRLFPLTCSMLAFLLLLFTGSAATVQAAEPKPLRTSEAERSIATSVGEPELLREPSAPATGAVVSPNANVATSSKVIPAQAGGEAGDAAGGKTRSMAGRTSFVLGFTWLPAFCETRPNRPECVGQTADRPDASQMTLAGLWPVRNSFCKVSEALQAEDRMRNWTMLPRVPLSVEIAKKLAVAMPGTVSGLDRHLWLRNGSCQVLEPDAYFTLQMDLLDTVNASAVGDLFQSRIGAEITEEEVKNAFDRSFAAGAGDRVRLQCRKVGDRVLVTGLTIGLSEPSDPSPDLAALVHSAAPTRSRCSGGVMDTAGRIRVERQAGAATAEKTAVAVGTVQTR